MAGDNKIKISADTSSIKRSLMDLSKDVKDLGKSKVAIFDKSQKDFLSKEASKHIKNIRKQINQNNKSIIATTKLLNKEGRTLEQNLKTRQRLTNMMKTQVQLQKEMQKLSEFEGGITKRTGIMSRMRGGLSGMGLGGVSRMLGPLGIALGAGGLAVSRAVKANQTFRGGIQDRIQLRGRGVTDMNLQDQEAAARVGLNAQSMRRARLSAMDIFGQAGSTQQAVMQRATFERNFGLRQGTTANLGQNIRGTVGGAGANKAVMTMQASLIASGITDEIGPYLETAASMLTSINEKGITFNDSAMGLLADLASREDVAPERVGRLATTLDAAIRNSTGESNAFMQQVFSRAGVGGGTLGGIQAAIRSGGLFGANTQADALISQQDKAMFRRTGIGGQNMKQVAGQTIGLLDTLFGTDQQNAQLSQEQQDNKRLQRLGFVRRTFGLQSEVEAANVEQLLKSAATGRKTEKEVQQELSRMQKGNTELGNLQMINDSVAGQTEILKNLSTSISDEMGENLGPIFNTLDKTMMKLDTTLSSIMDFFGIKIKPPLSKEDLQDEYRRNERALSKMEEVGPVSPRVNPIAHEKYMKRQRLMQRQQTIKSKFKERGLDIPFTGDEDEGTGKYLMKGSQAPELQDNFGKQLQNVFTEMTKPGATKGDSELLIPLMRENIEIQKRSAKANEVTAKNSKTKNGAPAKTPRE